MEPVQVALVDDHAMFRNGLAALVNNFNGFQVMLQAGNGKELFQKISKKFYPHIVVLDISMPEMNGIETALKIRQEFPQVYIIVLSMHNDAERVLAMIDLGVRGYLLKDYAEAELLKAMQVVSAGGKHYPPFVSDHMVDDRKNHKNGALLNSRELEFIRLACTELTYKEIADKMNVSNRTVDGYRDDLFLKLKIKNRVGLVLYAIKHKLVKVDDSQE